MVHLLLTLLTAHGFFAALIRGADVGVLPLSSPKIPAQKEDVPMRKMIGRVILFTVLMILSIASSSFSASYTTYNNLSAFSSASGALVSQDFNSYTDYNTQMWGYTGFLPGMNVTSNMNLIKIWQPALQPTDHTLFAFDGSDSYVRANGNAYYQINFTSSYKAAGFDITAWETNPPEGSGSIDNGTIGLYFEDGTSYSFSLSQATSGAPVFFGVVADTNLTKILWYEPHEGSLTGASAGNEETSLDNLVVGNPVATPEPATMLLLGFGIAGLAGARRFRK
jgi:hypothetical protein